jgi:uncharacterized OsmC-like protein
MYTFRGRGLSEKAVADALHLSEHKYCSVKATLDKAVDIRSAFRIIEDT